MWKELISGHSKRPEIIGLLLGLLFAATVYVKNIFEVIAPLFLLPFIVRAFIYFRDKDKDRLNRSLRVLACCAIAFYVPVVTYKFVNQAINGDFAFTNRASWALYGNTARRVEPLTAKRLQAAVVYLVNPHFCTATQDQKDCDFWSYIASDNLSTEKLGELKQQGLTSQQIDGKMIILSAQKALERPLQYAFLTGLENFKMLFWETAKAGQVFYPRWLEGIYSVAWFEPVLVLVAGFLCFFAFVWLVKYMWRGRKGLLGATNLERHTLSFFVFWMILSYSVTHSFFFVLQRYAVPLAPLWIIAIAFCADELLLRRRRTSAR